ncbi:MAG: M10 family metallopeptidase C-terminal domain-containing protein [Rhodobacterales bacterium]|nr:M10 family metallopeptidase C-terminal domain-containing protein [Rhodobacterales bacterium]
MTNPYYVDALLSTYSWAETEGTPVDLTYAFITADTIPQYYYDITELNWAVDTFVEMNATQKAAAEAAMALWAAVANVTFTEVTLVGNTANQAQILYGTADLGTGVAGGAWYPGGSWGGDVWITNIYASYLTPSPGNYAFNTFIHEIGHALGLKHPGNYNAGGGGTAGPYLPTDEDDREHTVMSYYQDNTSYGSPQNPMLYDIAAIQTLYGANMSTGAGDTVYDLAADGYQMMALWDASGTDTLDLSGYGSGQTLDITSGVFSNLSNVYNFVIAYGADIENIVGSAYNDTLTGNDLANVITAGAGDDVVNAGAGNDTVVAGSGAGNDSYDGGADNDTITYASTILGVTVDLTAASDQGSGAEVGTDQIANIENVTGGFGDDILIGDALANTLDGGYGADSLTGGGGDDFLFGGGGDDWAFYLGDLADYTIVLNGTTATVSGGLFGEGFDTLDSIEFLQFADQFFDVGIAVAEPPTDFTMDIGVTYPIAYGNGWNGLTDADGEVTASFLFTGTNLELSLEGWDVDFADEVEVLLNGTSLGFLSVGPNEQLNGGDTFTIDALDQIADWNVLTFRQATNVTWKWGITDVLLTDLGAPAGTTVSLSQQDVAQAEGDSGTTAYTFTVLRVGDTTGTSSVDWTVGGAGVTAADFVGGVLPSGTVTFAADETQQTITVEVAGDTTVELDETFTVTLSNPTDATLGNATVNGVIQDDDTAAPTADIVLTPGTTVTDDYGNGWNGVSDADGAVTAEFQNLGVDYELSLKGWDVDFGDEIEVLLNGNHLGYLSVGPNEQLNGGDTFAIDLADQIAGTNILTFLQTTNVTYKWGVTDILLSEVVAPTGAVVSLATPGPSQAEGDAGTTVFTFTVNRTGDTTGTSSVDWAVSGADVDGADFVGGVLPSGTVSFAADETVQTITVQVNGDTDLEGDEAFTVTLSNPTDATIATAAADAVILDDDTPADMVLTPGTTVTDDFGNNWNGLTEPDGLVTAAFTNTGTDLELSLKGWDVDFADEVEVLLNGVSLGFLSVGVNEQLNGGDTFAIAAGDQITGTNILTFQQATNVTWKWGVTDILLTEVVPPSGAVVSLATPGPGQAEGDAGTTVFTFTVNRTGDTTGTSAVDWAVSGTDVDGADFLGGVLPSGTVNFAADETVQTITVEVAGDTTIEADETFTVTLSNPTDATIATATADGVILDDDTPADIALVLDTTVTDQYGNGWNGLTEADGLVTASFDYTGTDLLLSLQGWDVDFADEVEVLLNGNHLGYLSVGVNEQLNAGDTFAIGALDQVIGTNELTFQQATNVTWKWGVTNILLTEAGGASAAAPDLFDFDVQPTDWFVESVEGTDFDFHDLGPLPHDDGDDDAGTEADEWDLLAGTDTGDGSGDGGATDDGFVGVVVEEGHDLPLVGLDPDELYGGSAIV